MKSQTEIIKKINELKKEHDWMSKCRNNEGIGNKVGCIIRESRNKNLDKLDAQIRILEWILEK